MLHAINNCKHKECWYSCSDCKFFSIAVAVECFFGNNILGICVSDTVDHAVVRMVLSDPAGEIGAETRGTCRGRIRLEPRGTSGFGYDPLFEIVEYHRTFAELGPLAKACLSHRARAARCLLPQLVELIERNPPDSTTDMKILFSRLAEQLRRRGLIIVISDLLTDVDEGALAQARDTLAELGATVYTRVVDVTGERPEVLRWGALSENEVRPVLDELAAS